MGLGDNEPDENAELLIPINLSQEGIAQFRRSNFLNADTPDDEVIWQMEFEARMDEIAYTPWKERHMGVLDAGKAAESRNSAELPELLQHISVEQKKRVRRVAGHVP
ncbi:hypothetical protein [Leucobacter komagatae]|uniref:Uncharacterized protein n=1 Tax=Leucobacter komagatae TaxID=55969 RepID=A0A0D0HZJ0_9MICO|nr:hypothetical protein [Leucobacter komagatae]KIP52981.1 hypothetical protein SD72_05610 [Leucobacter komagatae]